MEIKVTTNYAAVSILASQLLLYSGLSVAWGDKCADLIAGLDEINVTLEQNVSELNSTYAYGRDACRSSSLSACSYSSSYSSGLQGNIANLRRERQAILSRLTAYGCNPSAQTARTRGRAVCGRLPPKTTYFGGIPMVIINKPNATTGRNYTTLEEDYENQCSDR